MNTDTIFHQFKLIIINNFDNLLEPFELIKKVGTAREIRKINVLNNAIQKDYYSRLNKEIHKFIEPFLEYGFHSVSSYGIHHFYKSEEFLFNKFEKNNLREMLLNVPLFGLECIISGDKFLLDKHEFCDFVKNNDIPVNIFNKNIPIKIPLETPDEIHIFGLKSENIEAKIKVIKKFANNIGISVVKVCLENFDHNLHVVFKASHRPLNYFGEYYNCTGFKVNISKLPIISVKYNPLNKFIDFNYSDFNAVINHFEPNYSKLI